MTISAQVIAHSISPAGKAIATLQLRYPRFIHAEFMTHLVFSRNASSSRAIPVEKMIEDLVRDPAMPVYWGKNQKGMQAGAELDEATIGNMQAEWLRARDASIASARLMIEHGLHKQIANRILEPWAHINVVVTATDWGNFFALRCHPAAQPEMRELAMAMYNALEESVPETIEYGQYHLPYILEQERDLPLKQRTMFSVARCARVSYLSHAGHIPTTADDEGLYKRLVGSDPKHASPAEHQATPDRRTGIGGGWGSKELHGNFNGWVQYRKLLPDENILRYFPSDNM